MPRKRKNLRRAAALLLAALLLALTGCSSAPGETPGPSGAADGGLRRYQANFLELFDTVTTVVGYAETEDEFYELVNGLRDELSVYHQLYDIYNDYEGLNNIKTINDNAGGAPVEGVADIDYMHGLAQILEDYFGARREHLLEEVDEVFIHFKYSVVAQRKHLPEN